MSSAYRINPGVTLEQRHVDRVMHLGCAACCRLGLLTPAEEFHHIRAGMGAAQRSTAWLGFGLCWQHHQGKGGIHSAGTKGFAVIAGFSELDLLSDTFMRLTLQYEGNNLQARLGVGSV